MTKNMKSKDWIRQNDHRVVDMPLAIKCPHCTAELDAHITVNSPITRPKPRPNDIGMCNDCGGLFLFGGDDQQPVIMSDEAFAKLPEDLKQIIKRTQKMVESNPSIWDKD